MNTLGNIMSTLGDIMSTSGVFSTSGGYHEYIGVSSTLGCRVHRGDIMMNVGGNHE